MDRVLQEARDSMAMVDGARDSLDARAQQLVQAAGLIIVLVSVIKLPEILAQPAPWSRIAFAFAFFVFLGMVWLALRVWWPRSYGTPGGSLEDWEMVYQNSLNVSDDQSFMQVWTDYQRTIDLLIGVNIRKARYLKGAMALFLVQIAGLLAMALLG